MPGAVVVRGAVLALAGGDVAARGSASKVLRRCRRMDAEHADGPASGVDVHGAHCPAGRDEPWRSGGPCPIRVLRVHRPASALKLACLAACRTPAQGRLDRDARPGPCTCPDRRAQTCGITPCPAVLPRRHRTLAAATARLVARTPCTCSYRPGASVRRHSMPSGATLTPPSSGSSRRTTGSKNPMHLFRPPGRKHAATPHVQRRSRVGHHRIRITPRNSETDAAQ